MKLKPLYRIVFIALALVLALGTPTLMRQAFPQSPAQTATAPPKFALIEFFKLERGKGPDHRKIERELWMPIHRERVKLGKIKSWSLMSKVLPGVNGSDVITQLNATRKTVRTEVLTLLEQVH
jgi:hypothetical protein